MAAQRVYEIVHGNDLDDLEFQVNEKLKRGWQLVGGIAIRHKGSLYAQVMIKDLPEAPEEQE